MNEFLTTHSVKATRNNELGFYDLNLITKTIKIPNLLKLANICWDGKELDIKLESSNITKFIQIKYASDGNHEIITDITQEYYPPTGIAYMLIGFESNRGNHLLSKDDIVENFSMDNDVSSEIFDNNFKQIKELKPILLNGFNQHILNNSEIMLSRSITINPNMFTEFIMFDYYKNINFRLEFEGSIMNFYYDLKEANITIENHGLEPNISFSIDELTFSNESKKYLISIKNLMENEKNIEFKIITRSYDNIGVLENSSLIEKKENILQKELIFNDINSVSIFKNKNIIKNYNTRTSISKPVLIIEKSLYDIIESGYYYNNQKRPNISDLPNKFIENFYLKVNKISDDLNVKILYSENYPLGFIRYDSKLKGPGNWYDYNEKQNKTVIEKETIIDNNMLESVFDYESLLKYTESNKVKIGTLCFIESINKYYVYINDGWEVLNSKILISKNTNIDTLINDGTYYSNTDLNSLNIKGDYWLCNVINFKQKVYQEIKCFLNNDCKTYERHYDKISKVWSELKEKHISINELEETEERTFIDLETKNKIHDLIVESEKPKEIKKEYLLFFDSVDDVNLNILENNQLIKISDSLYSFNSELNKLLPLSINLIPEASEDNTGVITPTIFNKIKTLYNSGIKIIKNSIGLDSNDYDRFIGENSIDLTKRYSKVSNKLGDNSFVAGNNISDYGNNSTIIGNNIETNNNTHNQITLGNNNKSIANNQTTIGNNLKNMFENNVIIGKFNNPDNKSFAVGCGENEENRKNVLSVSNDGMLMDVEGIFVNEGKSNELLLANGTRISIEALYTCFEKIYSDNNNIIQSQT